jgi:hypothetical protein
MSEIWVYLLIAIAAVPMMYSVHLGMNRICRWHARTHCAKNHLQILSWKIYPAFDPSGVKTEFTLVEVDCLDAQKQRQFVRLLVWPFGIRRILASEAWDSSVHEMEVKS